MAAVLRNTNRLEGDGRIAFEVFGELNMSRPTCYESHVSKVSRYTSITIRSENCSFDFNMIRISRAQHRKQPFLCALSSEPLLLHCLLRTGPSFIPSDFMSVSVLEPQKLSHSPPLESVRNRSSRPRTSILARTTGPGSALRRHEVHTRAAYCESSAPLPYTRHHPLAS